MKKCKNAVVVSSALFIGLILLISGTGKVPGQLEFFWALLQTFWTPAMAYFISYLLPWVEIILGIFLLVGLFPRIAAALCLPIIAGFIANNSWAVSKGLEEFQQCAYCFGAWEEFLGNLSPLGALILDIVLLGLALIVLILHEEGFLTFRPWFIRRQTKERVKSDFPPRQIGYPA